MLDAVKDLLEFIGGNSGPMVACALMALAIGWLVMQLADTKKDHKAQLEEQAKNLLRLAETIDRLQQDINNKAAENSTALMGVLEKYHTGTSSIREAIVDMKATIAALVAKP